MALIIKNSLTRKSQAKLDKITDLEEQVDRLEDDIRRLKIEFDIFFNGGTNIPPHKKRASLEARFKRINGNRSLSYAMRYKMNALLSRYTSYRELWRRRLKAMGEDVY